MGKILRVVVLVILGVLIGFVARGCGCGGLVRGVECGWATGLSAAGTSWSNPSNAVDVNTGTYASYTISAYGISNELQISFSDQYVDYIILHMTRQSTGVSVVDLKPSLDGTNLYTLTFNSQAVWGVYWMVPVGGMCDKISISFYNDDASSRYARVHEVRMRVCSWDEGAMEMHGNEWHDEDYITDDEAFGMLMDYMNAGNYTEFSTMVQYMLNGNYTSGAVVLDLLEQWCANCTGGGGNMTIHGNEWHTQDYLGDDELLDWLVSNGYITLAGVLALNYTGLNVTAAWVEAQNYTTQGDIDAWADLNNVVMGGIGMPLWYILGIVALAAGAWWAKSMLVYIMLAAMAGAGFPLAESAFGGTGPAYFGMVLILVLAVVYSLAQILGGRVEHL